MYGPALEPYGIARRMDYIPGQLLIAAPALVDPNFRRTVVLITEHSAEGAMGLVLNRPSPTTVAEAAPELAELVDGGASVFVGGPVQPSAALVLAEFDDPSEAGLIVQGDIGLLPAEADVEVLAATTRRTRVFAGYSGWGAGQLDDELDAEGWIVTEAAPDDVFAHDTDGLWSAVLGRKGGQYALLARMPDDPSVN